MNAFRLREFHNENTLRLGIPPQYLPNEMHSDWEIPAKYLLNEMHSRLGKIHLKIRLMKRLQTWVNPPTCTCNISHKNYSNGCLLLVGLPNSCFKAQHSLASTIPNIRLIETYSLPRSTAPEFP